MRLRIVLAVLVGVLALAWPVQAQTRSERLVIGEQRTFKPGYAVGDIAISNPSVCDYRVMSGRREVMLIANGEGFTTLTVWDQRSVKRDEVGIEVVSREYAKLMGDLADLLRPYPGITIKRLGSRIVLAGTVGSAGELENVKTIASAVDNLVLTVTVRGDAAAPDRPAPDAATPETSRAVPHPAPPPPARRPAPNAPEPVPLRPAPPAQAAPIPQATPSTAVAVPAPAAPPPPNVTTGTGARTAPPANLDVPVGTGSIEYLVEIYESPSSAPPPEAVGPQGTRLYMARLRTGVGREVRQFVNVGPKTAKPPRGISLGLTPRVQGSDIQTVAVVDTNLPVGPYEQKQDPVWLRCTVNFTVSAGQTRFVNEQELASSATPTGAPPSESSGSGTGAKVADVAVGVGQGIATANVPGASYIPSFGGIFGGGGSGQPKARKTMLLIVLTPIVVGPVPR